MAMNRGTITIALTFVVGCITGLAIGGYQGYRVGTSTILNDALSKDAREVGIRITTLKELRAGQRDQAIDRLETGLAGILIAFDPDVPYKGLNGQTVGALRKAIADAKAYRAVYPRFKPDFKDKMVDNLFSRELYK
jgi:hypothetical protein